MDYFETRAFIAPGMISEPSTAADSLDAAPSLEVAGPVSRSVGSIVLRSVVGFALAGLLWALLSERILAAVAAGNDALEDRLRWIGHAVFLVGTAGLLFFFLKRHWRLWEEQGRAREAGVEQRLQLGQTLSKLAEVAPDVMFSFRRHPDGHFSFPFTNRRMADFFAGSTESLVEDAWPAIATIHEEDLPAFIAAVEQSGETLTAFRQELRLCHPERGVIWIDIHSMPERESDGGTLWHGFFRDITERQAAQAQVREMAGLLHAVVEQSTDAVFVKDRDGRYLLCNEAAARFMGRPVSEIIGRDDREFFDPESAGTLIARHRRVMASGVAETEEETITAAGIRRTFLAMKAPFRDSDGRIVGTIGISRDISERNEAEVALRESERRLNFALDATLDGIWDWNIQTGQVYFSPQWARLLGYEPGELPQRVDFFFTTLHPDDAGHLKQILEDHLTGRTAMKQEEVRLRMKSGDYRWFLDRGKVVTRDGAGHPLRLVGTITDITQRKAAESALQQAYDDLRQTQEIVVQQERLRAFGEMASGVAHDINNAICPISIYTAVLLKSEPDLSPRTREFLGIIQQAAEGVGATVARLREFYREHDGPLGFLPVNLAALVGEVVTLTRARWSDMEQERGVVIQVRTELEAERLEIAGVENEIREAMVNLVFNAVDAMPEGGTLTLRAGTIRPRGGSRAARAAARIFVEIADTGIGMDEEARRRCLEPFYTTKGEHGTGLGLAIVCGILQRHDAQIAIESEVGVGTTIRLIFPLPGALAASEPPRAETEVVPPMKILVVDDDADILVALRVALEAEGHHPLCVPGGQAGIDAFRAALEAGEPFDLVCTDLGMPEVDGRKVAAAVKAASPTTPVILVTGWGASMKADGDIPPGVDRIVAKPASPRDLNEALAFCHGLRSSDS